MSDEIKLVANGLALSKPYFTKDANYLHDLARWKETVTSVNYTLRQNIKGHDEKAFKDACGYPA